MYIVTLKHGRSQQKVIVKAFSEHGARKQVERLPGVVKALKKLSPQNSGISSVWKGDSLQRYEQFIKDPTEFAKRYGRVRKTSPSYKEKKLRSYEQIKLAAEELQGKAPTLTEVVKEAGFGQGYVTQLDTEQRVELARLVGVEELRYTNPNEYFRREREERDNAVLEVAKRWAKEGKKKNVARICVEAGLSSAYVTSSNKYKLKTAIFELFEEREAS